DPARPKRAFTIMPDLGAGGPITEHERLVWIAGSGPAGYVFPIDSRTGAQGSQIDVGGPVHDIPFGAGSLWVLSGGAVRQQPYPALRAVALHDRLVRAKVAVGNDPVAVVATAGFVWVASGNDRTVSRVDPSQARLAATIKLGARPTALA